MKKSFYLLPCIFILCFLAACGSGSEDHESMIQEVSDLPDAEIKIPATLLGDELADVPIIAASPAPDTDSEEIDPAGSGEETNPEKDPSASNDGSDGRYGQLDENNNVTYNLDGETRTQILNDLALEIQNSIDTILADKYYYPNISDIQANSDCTEFTIYLTVDRPNIYESMLMMSFYTVGDRYQIYNGVPMEQAKTTVVYINVTTGAELARTDSTSVQ